LRREFLHFFYSNSSLAERFDRFLSMQFIGARSLAEITYLVDPNKYPFFNEAVKEALKILGL